jgi:hypothetical protein
MRDLIVLGLWFVFAMIGVGFSAGIVVRHFFGWACGS